MVPAPGPEGEILMEQLFELIKVLAALTMFLTVVIFALWFWQDFGTEYKGEE